MLSPFKKYYTQSADQDDLISIGTIGLIKGISTYRPEKNVRLATYASRCIENEVLMYFRSMKKSAGDISLSESIETDGDGNSLSVMDVLTQDDDMFDNLSLLETRDNVRKYIDLCLDDREAEIIRKRYGLSGQTPKTQREVAAECGISRSYVSRRAYCKRCAETVAAHRIIYIIEAWARPPVRPHKSRIRPVRCPVPPDRRPCRGQ